MTSLIKQRFDEKFRPWQIELPADDLAARRRGSIQSHGWTIRYHFGSEQGRDYLEYFASHRMTNDTLNRIYEDGEEALVGFSQEFYEADNPEAEHACREHNRAFYRRVRELGL